MFLGIDLGTSAVNVLVIGETGDVVAEASAPLTRVTPQPRWSEQHPADWWAATIGAVRALPEAQRRVLRGIGLAGQMHGAVLLDRRRHRTRGTQLARMAVDRVTASVAFAKAPTGATIEPDAALAAELAPRRALFRALYSDLGARFAASADNGAAGITA